MVKVESNMLILDTTFSKQDAEAINHFVEIAKDNERERIIKIIRNYGSEDFTAELISIIRESN